MQHSMCRGAVYLTAVTWHADMQSPVEDFHCALQKKICLQGRLYLFQQHVCFYSNLFGFVKSKVIPLQVMPVPHHIAKFMQGSSAGQLQS